MFDENNSGDIDKTKFSKLTEGLGLEINEKTNRDVEKFR